MLSLRAYHTLCAEDANMFVSWKICVSAKEEHRDGRKRALLCTGTCGLGWL